MSGTNLLTPAEQKSGLVDPKYLTDGLLANGIVPNPVGTETLQGIEVPKGNFDPLMAMPGGIPITASEAQRLQTAAHGEADLVQGFAGPIDAYHGTPHEFVPEPGAPAGQFKDEKIGTGEGAQAYGYGHYVAGNKGIAEGYRDRLAGRLPGKEEKPPGNLYHVQVSSDEHELLDWDKPLSEQPQHLEKINRLAENQMMKHPDADFAIDGHPILWSDLPNPETRAAVTNLLAFNMNAEKAKMKLQQIVNDIEASRRPDLAAEYKVALDWLEKNAGRVTLPPPVSMKTVLGNEASGEDFYRLLTDVKGGQKEASEALQSVGIPGIRYLDASSRRFDVGLTAEAHRGGFDLFRVYGPGSDALGTFATKEEAEAAAEKLRTRNYVIFDPQQLRIVGKNGKMLAPQPVDHDPFGGGDQ